MPLTKKAIVGWRQRGYSDAIARRPKSEPGDEDERDAYRDGWRTAKRELERRDA